MCADPRSAPLSGLWYGTAYDTDDALEDMEAEIVVTVVDRVSAL